MADEGTLSRNQKAAYREGFKRGRSQTYARGGKGPLNRSDLAKMRSSQTPREVRSYILGVRDGAKKRTSVHFKNTFGGGRRGGGSSSGS